MVDGLTDLNFNSEWIGIGDAASRRSVLPVLLKKEPAMSKKSNALGEFKYDRTYELHKTKLKHRGREIDLSISVRDEFDFEDASPVAIKFWRERSQWFKKSKELALLEQFEKINDYLQNDSAARKISRTQFAKALAVPESIALEMDEDQTWFALTYFSDLFGDHTVDVSIHLSDGSMDSDVQALY